MDTKKMVLNAILIAIGVILHAISPSFGLPAQPDFALAMLFIIMLINRDYKTTIFAGIIIGIFTALTTKSPGGQLPNIIDKVVTANVIYFIFKLIGNRVNNNIKMIIALSLGTVLSGFVFLGSASLLVGLPGSLVSLISIVVIPAAIMNIFLGMILYKAIVIALKATGVLIRK